MIRIVVAVLFAFGLMLTVTSAAQAIPAYGTNCASCHGTPNPTGPPGTTPATTTPPPTTPPAVTPPTTTPPPVTPPTTLPVANPPATPPAAGALTIEAAMADGQDWVYQNSHLTRDRLASTLNITIKTAAQEGETYTVTLAEKDGGQNFSVSPPTDPRAVDPLVWKIVGGREGGSVVGPHVITVTVTGDSSGQSATAEVSLTLRKLGDINGDGAVDATDLALLTARLQGKQAGYPERAFDLNGDGQITRQDVVIMASLVGGVNEGGDKVTTGMTGGEGPDAGDSENSLNNDPRPNQPRQNQPSEK